MGWPGCDCHGLDQFTYDTSYYCLHNAIDTILGHSDYHINYGHLILDIAASRLSTVHIVIFYFIRLYVTLGIRESGQLVVMSSPGLYVTTSVCKRLMYRHRTYVRACPERNHHRQATPN